MTGYTNLSSQTHSTNQTTNISKHQIRTFNRSKTLRIHTNSTRLCTTLVPCHPSLLNTHTPSNITNKSLTTYRSRPRFRHNNLLRARIRPRPRRSNLGQNLAQVVFTGPKRVTHLCQRTLPVSIHRQRTMTRITMQRSRVQTKIPTKAASSREL